MIRNVHERAQALIALADAQKVSAADRTWLNRHLEECPECRNYASNTSDIIQALRSLPVAASSSLVAATQFRVRLRAQELRRRQERLWLVWISCVLVTSSAGLTTLLAWRSWEWLGQQLEISSLTWQVCFVLIWMAPVLIGSLLLLAKGTHLAEHTGTWEGQ
jgi:predicted anti-sigma-YlaC factor YlaD